MANQVNGEALRIDNIHLEFKGLKALSGVSLAVEKGTIYSIIGPNGAGKTSLINCISGVYKPAEGRIIFEGRNIIGLKPHRIAGLGIARTFQNIALFKSMSVLDNILLGRHLLIRYGALASVVYYGNVFRTEIDHRQRIEQIIDFLEMEEYRKWIVGSLPYGIQKRVELARALAMDPRILILDEPFVGMSKEEKADMVRFITDVHEEMQMTIIVIDHDMRIIMDISDRIAVLDFGCLIAEGLPEDIQASPEVARAYLGV